MKRNPVAKAHSRLGAGSGRHKDRRRPARSAIKANLRKEARL
jgi:hypothetical protein